MKYCLTLLVLFVTLITNAQTTINYIESFDDFPNPERGFYRYSEARSTNYQVLDVNTLLSFRALHQPHLSHSNYLINSTLTFRYFFLTDFLTSPISQTYLDNMQQDFAAARAAGVKIIPRFAYTDVVNPNGCASWICPPYGDASKAQMLEHIAQVGPVLTNNKDVIACLQMGFIGVWGEQYYTDHFGNASDGPDYKLTDANWNDRNEILQALLDATPDDMMIQVRYPQMKQRLVYGVNAPTTSPALTMAEAYSETDKARIAFHNDCFLASATDFGTYNDYGNDSSPSQAATGDLKPYLEQDSKFVIVGGETCSAFGTVDDCAGTAADAIADTEMARFHYTYLNAEYNFPDVNSDWLGVCMDDIIRKLGYRIVLQNATFTNQAQAGQQIQVDINLTNIGFAAPFSRRAVELVLRNTATNQLYFAPLNTDPRYWFTNETININQSICIPSAMPQGNYQLLLNLYDMNASIHNRPEYAIRLANQLPNTNDVWEAATGYNDLGHTLIVNNTATQATCSGQTTISLCHDYLKINPLLQANNQANSHIQSNAIVPIDGVNYEYKAGNNINLEEGFCVPSGALFQAIMDDCAVE